MGYKKKSRADKIRALLRKKNVDIDPLLEGLLEQHERLETIMSDLYSSYAADAEMAQKKAEQKADREGIPRNSALFKEYTNKSGATNIIISDAVKEYKQYSQRFNETTKTLDMMLRARLPEEPPKEDPLDTLNKRERLT